MYLSEINFIRNRFSLPWVRKKLYSNFIKKSKNIRFIQTKIAELICLFCEKRT